MTSKLIIGDPKRTRSQNGRAAWYPYYAGFSYDFALDIIGSAGLPPDAVIADEWNGSGTTTSVAASLGYRAYGFDLNPVMIVVAKARLLSATEYTSIEPLCLEIIDKAAADPISITFDEPLTLWLLPKSAQHIRKLERAIRKLLVDHAHNAIAPTVLEVNTLSGVGAFFYLALFRTVRTLVTEFIASNPTWVKSPQDPRRRLRPNQKAVFEVFRSEALSMIGPKVDVYSEHHETDIDIRVASSHCLPLRDQSIQFALTSPAYCTRIDYAVATKPELAVLGYSEESFESLREQLMGTSTVPRITPTTNDEWGKKCTQFLKKVKRHKSRASDTYYYKNHVQYFSELYKSLGELKRIITDDGRCVVVVQDSFYKEIRNDLAGIVTQMAWNHGLQLSQRRDFRHTHTMAAVNPSTRRYRATSLATESVLVFRRTASLGN